MRRLTSYDNLSKSTNQNISIAAEELNKNLASHNRAQIQLQITRTIDCFYKKDLLKQAYKETKWASRKSAIHT